MSYSTSMKFNILQRVTLLRDFPEQAKAGESGVVTGRRVEGPEQYDVQIDPKDEDPMQAEPPLVTCGVNDLKEAVQKSYTYKAYCNNCGKELQTDFNRFDGRVCDQKCHDGLEWKKVLALMGSPPQPMPKKEELSLEQQRDAIKNHANEKCYTIVVPEEYKTETPLDLNGK